MSRVMRLFQWLSPVVAAIAISVCLTSAVQAAIVFDGDVSPTASNEWGSSVNGYVGYNAAGTVTVDNGSDLACRTGYIGYAASVAGEALIRGAGSTWDLGSGRLYVGYNGDGILRIENGASVSNGSGAVGYRTGSGGYVVVDGSGSSWTNSAGLSVGQNGTGVLKITNGAAVTSNGYLNYIGLDAVGQATVDGSGSLLTYNGLLYVGQRYQGTLKITNGSSVDNSAGAVYVGHMTTATGSGIDFGAAGGTLTALTLYAASSDFTGTGTVNTYGLVGDLDLTFDATATKATTLNASGQNIALTVDMSNSNNVGDLGAGYKGTGLLTIQNGATVYSTRGYVGNNLSSAGTVTITGSDSMWTTLGELYVADEGAGILNILNGATVQCDEGYISSQAAAAGIVNVSGVNSTWTTNSLRVGNGGTATLSISSGGAVTVADTTYVGTDIPTMFADSNLDFGAGGGTLTTKSLYVDADDITGIGTIQTRGLIADAMNVVFDSGPTTTITINGSGQNVNLALDMSDSNNVGDLGAGYYSAGTGTLTIMNGSTVYSAMGYVGYHFSYPYTPDGSDEPITIPCAAGTATVTGSGSTWHNLGDLYAGYEGDGTLIIENNGTVINDGVGYIGGYAGAGTVTVDGSGSSWTNGAELYVGGGAWDIGTGTLHISNGASVTNTTGYIASVESLGIVTVDGENSTWTNTSGNIYIAQNWFATGTLNLNNNGTVFANCIDGTAFDPEWGESSATVNFDGGILKAYDASNAGWIQFSGTGTGRLYIKAGGAQFDTNGYNMGIGVAIETDAVSTGGGLTKLGAGDLTLSGVNSYTGLTTVKAGSLTLVGLDTATAGAWDPVLTGGGADIQDGKLVFNYAGGTSPAATIATILDNSHGTSNPFSQANGAQIFSTTAEAAGLALGWTDDGVDKVTVMYTLYGDSNLDGSVNGTDLNAVLSNYNQSTQVWAGGDFNYDGSVNGTDLNTVLSNYNQSLSSSTAAVPEPSTLLLMVLGVAGLLATRRVRACTHR